MDILGIITGVGMPVGTLVIGMVGRWILAGQAAIKEKIEEKHSDLDTKIATNQVITDREISFLKSETRKFMAKEDLEKAFEHDRNGRKAIEQSAVYFNAKTTEDIVKLRENVARLEQNDTYLTKEFGALGERMDRGLSKLDGKVDKQGEKIETIAACVQEIAKKV